MKTKKKNIIVFTVAAVLILLIIWIAYGKGSFVKLFDGAVNTNQLISVRSSKGV